MKSVLSLVVILFVLHPASPQKFLKKLKEAVNEQLDTVLDPEAGENLSDNRMESERLKQLEKDTSNYNYIFSQGNRASFFANRAGKEGILLTLSKTYENEEAGVEAIQLETYEQIFDYNRSGERAIYINPKLAYLNFMEALSVLTDEVGLFSNSILDSAFTINDLVDVNSLNIQEKYALGKTIANISIVIHYEGKYHLSEDFINETIRFFEEEISSKTVALASLYNNHAVISQSQGRFTDAENYFDKAEKILNKNEKKGSLAHAILTSNKALLYNEIGQYDEAKVAIQEAKEIAAGELRDKGRDNVSFQINEGLIFYSSGDYERAEAIFDDILELKRKRAAQNQTDYANVENYLAGTLMESGKPARVPELLNDALRIFEKKYNKDHPAYIKTRHNLGRYYIYAGEIETALTHVKYVNTKYLNFFGDKHPDYLSSLEDLAVIAWKQSDFASASNQFKRVIETNLQLVENYFGAMSEYEKGQYWAKVRPSILKFYAYAVERGNEDPSLLTEM
ncbi:MAG: tetratricopeptide repeat protein, partial [Ekhidna sp.]